MEIFSLNNKAKTVLAYKDTFNTESGKKVLHDLCKSCHIYKSTMDSNPHEMAYKEGERSVVLRILKTLEIDPYELDKKFKEI